MPEREEISLAAPRKQNKSVPVSSSSVFLRCRPVKGSRRCNGASSSPGQIWPGRRHYDGRYRRRGPAEMRMDPRTRSAIPPQASMVAAWQARCDKLLGRRLTERTHRNSPPVRCLFPGARSHCALTASMVGNWEGVVEQNGPADRDSISHSCLSVKRNQPRRAPSQTSPSRFLPPRPGFFPPVSSPVSSVPVFFSD